MGDREGALWYYQHVLALIETKLRGRCLRTARGIEEREAPLMMVGKLVLYEKDLIDACSRARLLLLRP